MKIVTYRSIFNPDSTGGRTYIDGEFIAHSQENACRAYGVKIPRKTAIGAGLYDVKLRASDKFGRAMVMLYTEGDYCIANGIRFSYIYNHGGNTADDSDGCLLNAIKRINHETIQGSMELEIRQRIECVLARREPVTWMIVNDYTGELEPISASMA